MVSQSELHAVWSSSELKGGLPVNAFGSCAGQKIFCLFERAMGDQTDRRFRDSPPDAGCDHCEWRPFPLPGGTRPEAPDVRPHGRRFLSHCCATTCIRAICSLPRGTRVVLLGGHLTVVAPLGLATRVEGHVDHVAVGAGPV